MPSTLLTTSSSKLLQRIGKRANLFGSRHAFSNEQRLFSTEGAGESDHFEILGLKVRDETQEFTQQLLCSHSFYIAQPSFSVSQHELKSAYMKLISELHPDRHTLKSLDEQYLFQEKASQVTRAYTILSNPHERAVHLMRLAGKPIDEYSTVRSVMCILCFAFKYVPSLGTYSHVSMLTRESWWDPCS